MDFKESRLEVTIVIGAVVLFGGVFSLLKSLGHSSHYETEEIVYDMPRPVKSDVISEFDLSQREIVRKYVHSQKKKIEADKKKPAANPVAKAPPKKTTAPKKVAQSNTQKKQFDVNMVDTRRGDGLSPNSNYKTPTMARTQKPTSANNNEAPPLDEEKEKKKVSAEELRSLLAQDPSIENMNKALMALRNKEIQYDEFYMILEEMILTKKPDSQATALYALQAVTNVKSFSMLANHLDDLTPENRASGSKVLLGYAQPQRLAVLGQALQSQDEVVVKRAAEVITAGLELAKKGQPVTDPRVARGEPFSNQQAVQPYSQFVPIFQQWQQSNDAIRVDLANNFLTRW